MNCCHSPYCSSSTGMFTTRIAENSLKRYQRTGPDKNTQMIRDALVKTGSLSGDLLDIGGGIGALSIELLSAGVERATLVDASAAYIAAAQRESKRRGLEDRLEILHADFTVAGAELPQADIVTMNRVVCCYPDLDLLLNLALAHTGRFFAFSYPHDRWYSRAVIAVLNSYQRITKNPFRVFVHPAAQIRAIFAQNSFHQLSQSGTLEWAVEVWKRDGS